jgi:hypothetical protein
MRQCQNIEVQMRNRMNYVVMAALVVAASLVWIVAKTQRTPLVSVPVPQAAAQPAPVRIEIVQVPVVVPAVQSPSVQPSGVQPSAVQPSVMLPAPAIAQPQADATSGHIVQPGETVSSLAGDLLGKDSKTNRDAIINANASLQADPDKLVAGKTYRIPSSADAAAPDSAPVVAAPTKVKVDPAVEAAVAPIVKPAPVKVLKYTAAPGDTVGKMAAAFLGSDDQPNEDAIIAANPSLRADADHVEVGRAYRIPAPDGLSVSTVAAPASPRPTSQPDADQLVVAGSPRELRYTAVAGDTVSKMAIQLLGNDTQETRDLIIKNNPSLKKDPDRVIAGQTYWIPAPSASADAR